VIVVTVGTQLAFDRLTGAVDQWAGNHSDVEVVAQVGPSMFAYRHMMHHKFLSPKEMNRLFQDASLIVAHAGMGSVLTALKYRKPILIMPRKASLGEHRNDHQMATAKWLVKRPGVKVAWDESEVATILDNHFQIPDGAEISDFATSEMLERLKSFIIS
jgi:UDP-N-acetylglucosamine transferase subunit ALG13